MTRLCAYAITKAALQDLTGSSHVPSHWFDWEVDTVAVDGMPLRRFSIIDSAGHDQYRPWVDVVRDLGLTPYLLVSMEERTQAVHWPTEASWFIPVEVHCIDREAADESSAVADELSMPDQLVLDQWTSVCLGTVVESAQLEVPQALVMPYANALSDWAASPHTRQILLARDEPDYTRWPGVRMLAPADFAFWPSAAHGGRDTPPLFVPLRNFPVTGVGVRDGKVAAFGLLRASTDGLWPFGDALRHELMELIEPILFRCDFTYGELLGRLREGPTTILSTLPAEPEQAFNLNLGHMARSKGADADVAAVWKTVQLELSPNRRGTGDHVLKLYGAAATQQVRIVLRDTASSNVVLDRTLRGRSPGLVVQLAPDFDVRKVRFEICLR